MSGLCVLRGFADSKALKPVLEQLLAAAPVRRMVTPRGSRMAVSTTSCGEVGWISDRKGYRYSAIDPEAGRPWPPMPAAFARLASDAAIAAGYSDFAPESCLINRYVPGVGMGAHQDRDERCLDRPIVSVSLGLGARFFVVGPERRGRATSVDLIDGDVIVLGGVARLHYHGVRPLKPGLHPRFGDCRWNLTFREAL